MNQFQRKLAFFTLALMLILGQNVMAQKKVQKKPQAKPAAGAKPAAPTAKDAKTQAATAQLSVEDQLDELLDQADQEFDDENYIGAAGLYEKALVLNSKDAYPMFKAGICYLYMGQPKKGLTFIRNSKRFDPNEYSFYYFWLGRGYHLNQKVDSALIAYRKYQSIIGDEKDEYRADVERFIREVHRGRSYFISKEIALQADNLGPNVNSEYTESNPIVTPDGRFLIFVSRRPLDTNEQRFADHEFWKKLFISRRNPDDSWSPAVHYPYQEPNSHYLPIQFLDNGNKLLVHRTSGIGNALEVISREGDSWGKPEPYSLPLSDRVFDFDARLTPALDQVFYTGFPRGTQSDIMVSRRTAGGFFGKSEIVSPDLTTKEDESSPCPSADGKTLIFTSKGLAGIGGYDFFKSIYDPQTKKWSEAQPLGYPYNSPGDDMHYFETEMNGVPNVYIASSRLGGLGNLDIVSVMPTINVELNGIVLAMNGYHASNLSLSITNPEGEREAITDCDSAGRFSVPTLIVGRNYNVTILRDNDIIATVPIALNMKRVVGQAITMNFIIDYDDNTVKVVSGDKTNSIPFNKRIEYAKPSARSKGATGDQASIKRSGMLRLGSTGMGGTNVSNAPKKNAGGPRHR